MAKQLSEQEKSDIKENISVYIKELSPEQAIYMTAKFIYQLIEANKQ